MMANDNGSAISQEKAQIYETTAPLLKAMQAELKVFAQKKPEATLSKPKVIFINRLLKDLKELLQDEPNSKYLDLLEDEALPQYSDVVLIMSQYEAAMSAFRARHTAQDQLGRERHWVYSSSKKK
jgi:hypothetical protein